MLPAENFIVLYQELYFRHIYAKLKVSFEDRVQSFRNYVKLFDLLLGMVCVRVSLSASASVCEGECV